MDELRLYELPRVTPPSLPLRYTVYTCALEYALYHYRPFMHNACMLIPLVFEFPREIERAFLVGGAQSVYKPRPHESCCILDLRVERVVNA